MIRISTVCVSSMLLVTGVANAQSAPATPAAAPPASSQQSKNPTTQGQPQSQSRSQSQSRPRPESQSQARPDAVYPHPSGQDSPNNKKSAPGTNSGAVGSQQRPGVGVGTVEQRGAKAADQSAPVRKLAQQKTYTQKSGSKQDPGTACSTARPTPNGGVDCGTGGDSATLGKIVTKSQ